MNPLKFMGFFALFVINISSFLGDAPRETAKFCGDLSVTRPVVSVNANFLRVVFSSDWSVHQDGFVITYSVGQSLK